MTDEIIQIISGFLGSLGFAFLYNIKGKRLIATAIGGLLSWSIFLFLGMFIPSEALRYFIVSASISIYAEILSRILKTPTTTFIIPALIPLIPGGSLYYTMSSAFGGDIHVFLENAVDTILLALALALGVVVVLAGTRFIFRVKAAKERLIK